MKLASLTPREREVLYLAAQGHSNGEISRELHVVVRTVEKHLSSIFIKLGVTNRTEAAMLFWQATGSAAVL